MKKYLSLLAIAALSLVCSCSGGDKWYVGEWTNSEGATMTIRSDLSLADSYNPDWELVIDKPELGQISPVHEKGDETIVYVIEFDNDGMTLRECDEHGHVLDIYEKRTSLNSKDEDNDYENSIAKTNTTNKSGRDNSDKAWKATFDANNGYLVLKSNNRWSLQLRPDYNNIFIVLKGLGTSCSKGQASVIYSNVVREVGLFELYEGNVILYDFKKKIYAEKDWRGNEVNHDSEIIMNHIFALSLSPNVSISGTIFFNKTKEETFTQIPKSEIPWMLTDELVGY